MRSIIVLTLLLLSGNSFGQNSEGYCTGDRVKTYYKVFGTGSEVMLMINGGPGLSSNGFEVVAQTLADRYNIRTIIYDQRGTGKSIPQGDNFVYEDFSMDFLVEDIEALRRHFGLEKWMVFGQSFGGILASYYADTYRYSISKLILSASGGMSYEDVRKVDIQSRLTHEESSLLNYWVKQVRLNPSEENQYERSKVLAKAYVLDTTHVSSIAKRLLEVDMRVNSMVARHFRSQKFDSSEALSTFPAPVLILQGDTDVVPVSTAQRANSVFPNSTLCIIDDCGHYGWLDNPVQYYGCMDEFINEVSP